MTSVQDSKDLQTSLNSSLSALALLKDLSIADDNNLVCSFGSSSSSTTIGSRKSPPPPEETGITLEIRQWAEHANSTLKSPEDGRLKAHKLLMYFIETGKTFGLGESPYVEMLQDAADVVEGSRAISPLLSRECDPRDGDSGILVLYRLLIDGSGEPNMAFDLPRGLRGS